MIKPNGDRRSVKFTLVSKDWKTNSQVIEKLQERLTELLSTYSNAALTCVDWKVTGKAIVENFDG